MFTGLTTELGEITSINNDTGNIKITTNMDMTNVEIGSSIMCSGICLTAVKKGKGFFWVNISEETLKVTNAINWKIGSKLNLEKSLRVGDEIGGHFVFGHVDTRIAILKKIKLKLSSLLVFSLPDNLNKFVCKKGSVSIDGVSLTVNEVHDSSFTVNIIPHTYKFTTLGNLRVGDYVNFEVDMLARYVERRMKI